jgi:fatty acid synthase subunit alpha, fungi type
MVTVLVLELTKSLIHLGNLELISSVPSHNPTFVSRNFTEAEITYCRSQPSPPSSFAGRWVGKEAVFKSLGVKSQGAAAAMKDIEIVNDESGVPTVHLHGEAKARAIGLL